MVTDGYVDPQAPDTSLPLLNFLMSGDGTQPKSFKLNLDNVRGSNEWRDSSFKNSFDAKLIDEFFS
jgi:hypothetical protein